jgi:hypothetical protein
MSESERFLFVTTCNGVMQDLGVPVSISLGYNIDRVGLSVGCPFAREFIDDHRQFQTACSAPYPPEAKLTEAKLRSLPACYHLNRKIGNP